MPPLRHFVPALAGIAWFAACSAPATTPGPAGAETAAATAPAPTPGLVVVTAKDYVFQLPDEIPSGWTTFEFANHGQEPHFFLLTLLPEGHTLEQYIAEVVPPFDEAWKALQAGADHAAAGKLLGEKLPAWFADAKAMGGIGIVSPGETARTTLELEPGNYAMECYVRTAEGVFHGELGMLRPLTVTAETSPGVEPRADIDITLRNGSYAVTGALTPGHHVVAAHFAEQPAVGQGNDVHLVRLADDAALEPVVHWMDWMNLEGLQTPAPAQFVGGTQDMPVGKTAYFEIELEPGRYAWLAEQPEGAGAVEEFRVAAAGS